MNNELPDFVALRTRFDSDTFPNGARAELRRVAEPDDVALLPALYRLFPGRKPDNRLLRLSFFLPHARHAAGAKPLGVQLAAAKVGEARVLQVARSGTPLDIIQLRRLLIRVDCAVNWAVFGRTVWFWNDISKRQLVEDYYLAKFMPAEGDGN